MMRIHRRSRPSRPALPLLAGALAGAVIGAAAWWSAPVPAPSGVGAALGPAAAPPSAAPAPDPCLVAARELDVRDRLAQRLMVGVDAADPAGAVALVRTTQVGGVFLGGDGTALLEGRRLQDLQAVARVPVAVAVDDEGGRVQRVERLDGELPSARRMAATRSPDEVRELAESRARALLARGVTMNLAPTVDVGDQPAGAVIGDRSFGADPDLVTRYAGAFARGQRAAGLAVVLKHFPGHGRADGDSHLGRVSAPPLAELRATDLRPYADLLAADPATGVMVGHLDVPGLTDELPSSLTPATYALLRGEYGFDGLVLTDDLGAMEAVTGTFDLETAVLRALGAGADVALWSSVAGSAGTSPPAQVEAILDDLVAAVARDELDAGENERAAARVLRAKGACGQG